VREAIVDEALATRVLKRDPRDWLTLAVSGRVRRRRGSIFDDFGAFGVAPGRAPWSRRRSTRGRARSSPKAAAQPLVEYQQDPVGFFVDVLGIPEHTIRWSLNAATTRTSGTARRTRSIAMLEGLRDWEDVGVEAGTGHAEVAHRGRRDPLVPRLWEDSARLHLRAEGGSAPALHLEGDRQAVAALPPHFPAAVLTDLTIRMRGGIDDSWGARGYAVGVKAGERRRPKRRACTPST
jgi:hypothetical protein